MNKENSDFLKNTYPELFPKNFYFECEDGWFDLLCETAFKIYTTGQVPIATQIKEKFGGLRFYVDSFIEEVFVIIEGAEAESYTICEVCGKPGEIRRGGWVKTLCEEHHIERESRNRRPLV